MTPNTSLPDANAPIRPKNEMNPLLFSAMEQPTELKQPHGNVLTSPKEQPASAEQHSGPQEFEKRKQENEPQAMPVQKEERFLDETIEGLKKTFGMSKNKRGKIPQVRDEIAVKVEHIMEEGLADAFMELSTVERQEFKIKGEQTALQIRELLKTAKVKVKKIFQLIFAWLSILPGINRFFLEQEAKIKTDKIVSLKEQYK